MMLKHGPNSKNMMMAHYTHSQVSTKLKTSLFKALSSSSHWIDKFCFGQFWSKLTHKLKKSKLSYGLSKTNRSKKGSKFNVKLYIKHKWAKGLHRGSYVKKHLVINKCYYSTDSSKMT
jgi:hypothetical protein